VRLDHDAQSSRIHEDELAKTEDHQLGATADARQLLAQGSTRCQVELGGHRDDGRSFVTTRNELKVALHGC
jgi:hypothetical protein